MYFAPSSQFGTMGEVPKTGVSLKLARYRVKCTRQCAFVVIVPTDRSEDYSV